ncbi:hypothetical protein [Roseibium algae]|uniref:Superfamily III holin-X n=1 Tax=Roseibium algae TaxID=3123038 RepID=A0ABU8TJ20_9HYPH
MRPLSQALTYATRDVQGTYRRAKRNAVLTALAVFFFASAYLAGLIAAGAYLVPIFGPVTAALLIAGAMASIGCVILIVVGVLKSREKKRQSRRRETQRLATAAAISILPELVKSKGLLAVVALGGLAYLASRERGDGD